MRTTIPGILLLILLLAACGEEEPEGVWPPNDEAIAAMNRGLAALESFEYLPASRAFEAALEISPRWVDAKVNLAIALLNARGKQSATGESAPGGEFAETVRLLDEVLAEEPLNPRANFVAGVVLKTEGKTEESLAYFDRVIEADPRDAAAHYWKGYALNDLGRFEESDEEISRSIELNPYLRAAYYARRNPLMHLKRFEDAKKALETFRLLGAPPGKQHPFAGDEITKKAYTELGHYALAVRNYRHAPDDHEPSPVTFARPESPPFVGYAYGGDGGAELVGVDERADGETDREFVRRIVSRIGPGVVLGDYDGDGDADVFLPEWDGPGRLYRNDGGAAFADVTADAGLAMSVAGIGGTFFDADGDGDLDLYVTAAGPNVYYENRGDGTFADRTEATGLGGGDVVSISAAAGDFDHEGDVDLFVANYCRAADADLAGAPDALFQNNRNGTFTDVAGEQGIDGGELRSLGVLPLDADRDLDTDLLVIRDRQPASLWLNERVWNFRAGTLPPSLAGGLPAYGAAAGDIDRDGREEVLVLRGPGKTADLYRTDDDGALVPEPHPLANLRWRTGVFLDADLDGWVDLVGDDVVVLGADGEPVTPLDRSDEAFPGNARGAGFADLDGDGDLDRVWAAHDGAGIVITVAPGENHWLAAELIGREALQPSSWSARIGPGQELEMRAGRLWQPLRARTTTGFLSSIEGPVRFGLGGHAKASFLRIMWPDRVLQVEAELPADQVRRIEEVNRKPDSCPMLFVWDGKDYRFVSDFLGVGGLGFFAAPGVTGTPDGDEFVRIGKWAEAKDGYYELQVMEPLEEICYLDEATLVAVDHPAGWDAYPNERYVGDPALFPEPRIHAVGRKIFPRRAVDIAGKDVLGRILAEDRIYAPVVPDRRFPGIAAEHAVTLDFSDRVPEVGEGERLILFLDGTVEYGYSHTVFAVYQAGVDYEVPKLEVPDGDGGWRTVIGNTGFPAGLPKGMTIDVTGIVTPESPVFRIRTNLEVYWDRIFLGVDRADRTTIHRIAPETAHLHLRGYPREYSPDGRLPIVYDYALMDPGYPMKNMTGFYTKFGDVTPLVREADDMYVIMGRGEEVTLRYPESALPPLREGFERTLILYSAGWCKDMDPYTAFPDTVGPLPFRAMSGYPYPKTEHYPGDEAHRRYQKTWNTRRMVR